MSDESFKQMWQDSDRQRHAHVGGDITSLVQHLTQRNYELTTLVTTLVDLLAEAGHVDANVLLAKIEGQLESEIKPAMVAPPGGGPKVAMTSCARCHAQVPMSGATMTAQGLLCDRCALSA